MTGRTNHCIRISGTKKHLSAYGMFLFFLLLPFEYPLATIGVGSILRYVGILTMGVAVLDVLGDGRKIRIDYRIGMMLLWMVYAVISGFWCVSQSLYSYYISIYINNSLMFVIISMVVFTQEDAKIVEKGFVGGVILLLLYMTFVPGAITYSSWQNRLTLAYNGKELLDQNYLASIMVMQYGFFLYDVFDVKMKRMSRIIKAVIAITILYYILRTGSRGGLLAAGAITIVCICLNLKKHLATVLVLVCVLVMISPYILHVLPESLLDRFSLKALTGATSESGARLVIWQIAWEAIKNSNVVFGYGAGASEMIIGLRYEYAAAIHNAFIAQVVELGLIGLVLFVGVVVSMLRELLSSRWIKACVGFVGIIVSSIFLDVLTTKFFWAAMMMLTVQISACRTIKKATKENPQEA